MKGATMEITINRKGQGYTITFSEKPFNGETIQHFVLGENVYFSQSAKTIGNTLVPDQFDNWSYTTNDGALNRFTSKEKYKVFADGDGLYITKGKYVTLDIPWLVKKKGRHANGENIRVISASNNRIGICFPKLSDAKFMKVAMLNGRLYFCKTDDEHEGFAVTKSKKSERVLITPPDYNAWAVFRGEYKEAHYEGGIGYIELSEKLGGNKC